jgi:hypothetical protein
MLFRLKPPRRKNYDEIIQACIQAQRAGLKTAAEPAPIRLGGTRRQYQYTSGY